MGASEWVSKSRLYACASSSSSSSNGSDGSTTSDDYMCIFSLRWLVYISKNLFTFRRIGEGAYRKQNIYEMMCGVMVDKRWGVTWGGLWVRGERTYVWMKKKINNTMNRRQQRVCVCVCVCRTMPRNKIFDIKRWWHINRKNWHYTEPNVYNNVYMNGAAWSVKKWSSFINISRNIECSIYTWFRRKHSTVCRTQFFFPEIRKLSITMFPLSLSLALYLLFLLYTHFVCHAFVRCFNHFKWMNSQMFCTHNYLSRSTALQNKLISCEIIIFFSVWLEKERMFYYNK